MNTVNLCSRKVRIQHSSAAKVIVKLAKLNYWRLRFLQKLLTKHLLVASSVSILSMNI